MKMRDMSDLWNIYPHWLSKDQLRDLNLDPRRHIRYDADKENVAYVVRRSASMTEHLPGRFALCENTINWLDRAVYRRRIITGYLVLVEDFSSPPDVKYYCTSHMALEKVKHIQPIANKDDGNTFWWLDDYGEVVTMGGSFPGRPTQSPPAF